MKIGYLDGERLRRSLLAAADWVDVCREDLNNINVFPVPDGDTGTNFAMTLRGVADALRRVERAELSQVSKAMADASILAAHGNSGMLLSQFLLGFHGELGSGAVAYPADVARGFRGGANRVYAALDDPVEGTILTICREAAEAAEAAAPHTADLVDLLTGVLDRANDALRRTPDMLPSLKEAGVVDAGGKGFVRLLEGAMRLIAGEATADATIEVSRAVRVAAAATATVEADRDFQYCTEVLARGADFPPTTVIRETLRAHGGSIVVLATDDLLKIHIHTNLPEQVYETVAAWGVVESTKADDMREQHEALQGEARRSLGLVVDSSNNLPHDLVDRLGIVVVPISVMDGTRTYLDGIDIDTATIYERMRRDDATFSTSQPSPGAFDAAFRDARSAADEVLVVTLAAALSGTFNAARTAARASGLEGLTLVDSRTVSIGLGMLALRAQELAAGGWDAGRIAEELGRVRDQSGALVVFDTLEYVVRSGRVSRPKAWLAGVLDLKPIMELSSTGAAVHLDRVRGREATIPRVLEHLRRRLTPPPRRLRIGIVHADAPDIAGRLEDEIRRRFHPYECHVGAVATALGVHTGPGAWGVFYQIEDDAVTAPGEGASRT